MPFALYLLALAVFAMGTSEFMLAGLVPDLAADLGVTVGTAGLLTPAFAVGMIVGAPLMAAVGRRWSPRTCLSAFIAAFLVCHVVAAVSSSFALVTLTRVVAALANAGFLAVALSVAGRLVPVDRKGRALAVLLSGTTVAMIAGVPGGALLGAWLGWRSAFWAVTVACVPALLGVMRLSVPSAAGHVSLHAELAVLARSRVIAVVLLAALANAATFATFTYLAPIVTDEASLSSRWVSVALVVFGLGSFAGISVAGRLSDRRPGSLIVVVSPLVVLGWTALLLFASTPAALLVLVFVLGVLSFALGSTLVTRVLYEASDAVQLSGSYATAALNVGAAGGPLLSAVALRTHTDPVAPVWVSVALSTGTLALAVSLGHRLFQSSATKQCGGSCVALRGCRLPVVAAIQRDLD